MKVQIESYQEQLALLSPAKPDNMPTDWSFDWSGLWQITDFDCENIIQLVYSGKVWGLVRYGLYPYPGLPRFLEILHIEAHPTSRGEMDKRLVEPIGKWLIWYATKVGLLHCQAQADEPLIILTALESAVSYYRDKVQMEYLEPVTIAPGEDGYAFRFSRTAAAAFCQRQENQWGVPKFEQ